MKNSKRDKDWLDQVLGTGIDPRIPNLRIEQIPASTGGHYLVVTVPAGSTAHQASDCLYYRRYNFEATPMKGFEGPGRDEPDEASLDRANPWNPSIPSHAIKLPRYGFAFGMTAGSWQSSTGFNWRFLYGLMATPTFPSARSLAWCVAIQACGIGDHGCSRGGR